MADKIRYYDNEGERINKALEQTMKRAMKQYALDKKGCGMLSTMAEYMWDQLRWMFDLFYAGKDPDIEFARLCKENKEKVS